MELNKIYNENCLETMARMQDGAINLTVTSPPYDNLRNYNGYSFDFEPIARELFRVTKYGGVVVWIVNDATINGSETGTSFKQALYFKECGFRLHDTMVWIKDQIAYPDKNRYYAAFEYMFILSKGAPNSFNQIKDRKNKSQGRKANGVSRNGTEINKNYVIPSYGARYNYWLIYNQQRGIQTQNHPATFPEQLANDHIISWSNEGDIVYDPFIGSGTTAKMALANNRQYIGSEVSAEYIEIAKERLKQTKLF